MKQLTMALRDLEKAKERVVDAWGQSDGNSSFGIALMDVREAIEEAIVALDDTVEHAPHKERE